jgi:formylglycine-generating enzyme required for sulfatase activity
MTNLLPALLIPLLMAVGSAWSDSLPVDSKVVEPVAAPFVDSLGIELVRIPAGSFTMGSPSTERGRHANEGPARTVTITSPFLVGAREVTVGQFRRFVEDSGYVTDAERDGAGGFGIDFATGEVVQAADCTWRSPGFPGQVQSDDHPVVLISWQDAEAFCAWLSVREGATYRLPTEAEWEYACRGGTSTAYSAGGDPSTLEGHANVADRSLARAMPLRESPAPFDDGHAFTAPVGSFRPNGFGLHDMHGNVWEWCADWYDDAAYMRQGPTDPTGPTSGSFRTIRGGGWLNGPLRNRSAQRIYFTPSFRYCLLSGFRVVRDAGVDPASGD